MYKTHKFVDIGGSLGAARVMERVNWVILMGSISFEGDEMFWN